MEDKRLFLLDAFALIFRAYYALMRNPRMTSKGKNTNAQFGFINTLLQLLKSENPSHIAVCFDTPEATERSEIYADYKANREEAPEDLILAIPDIKKMIQAFNIPIIEQPGYEADDIIGTLSKKASEKGYEVYMVTSDKDYGQLVSDNVFMYVPPKGGGKFEKMGPKEVCEKWDIEKVDQVIDILGLMGDAVDNIPGIKGVGEKTAVKLLKEFGTLENVLENAKNIKGKLGEKVAEGKEAAIMSKKLATIITDVPCVFDEIAFEHEEWNREALKEIFAELEFRTLGKRLLGQEFTVSGEQQDLFGNNVAPVKSRNASSDVVENDIPSSFATIQDTPHDYQLIQEGEVLFKLIRALNKKKEICFDTETTGLDANQCDLVGMSFSTRAGKAYYIPCPADRKECVALLQQFSEMFANENLLWIGQNIKYDLLVLKNYGFQIKGKLFDTMLAHYCFEPEGKRGMDYLSETFLNYTPVSITELIGKDKKNQSSMRDVELEKIKDYAAEDADITFRLKEKFQPLLKENEVEEVFREVEMPLVPVLTQMEYEGVKIDTEFLKTYSRDLEKDAKLAEENVYKAAGVTFNLASPKQLGEVLFEILKLDPNAKKTKTGQYKTSEDVLVKLANEHRIVNDILDFRELSKLRNTYVDTLPTLINPKTGRVHTSYAQAVAVTGRLASVNPNLQNIPIRTARGREIRKAFIPRDKDFILLSADYSQIELRIVAAISGDKNMCEAFQSGVDIHTATASKVFGVEENDVTKEQRYKAKSVNFGIIYGQGAFGLAENLGISRTEAKEIIDNYKKEFNGINQYMTDTIAFAQEKGYVQTLMGRKRWLRDILSSNHTVRSFAERNAINSPIQGSAADMIKLAMIKIHGEMERQKFKYSRMILQVHDELVFDVHPSELEDLKALVLDCMQNAMPLPNEVPVLAEVGIGENWLEAH